MRTVLYVANNDVTLLETGLAFFPALLAAIDAAKYDILFETYIFSEDNTAAAVEAALIAAARRGVEVRVVVDWFGTGRRIAARLGQAFAEAGIHYRVFNPWFRRGVTRTHRKIAVIDRQVAFVGGINVNDDWLCDYEPHEPLPAPRWDFAVQVRGPLVAEIHREAQAQWSRVGHMNLIRRIELYREMRKQTLPEGERPMKAGFVVRDNLRNRRMIQRTYLQALGHARKSVLVATPYFAPGRKLRTALAQAARRGVDVRLMIGVGEFRLQDAVAHSFYPRLLAAGVKIYEYRKTQLHGKVAVVDDDWTTVGSSNCDGLSLFINQEANVVVKDAEFAATVRGRIEAGLLDAIQVERQQLADLGWMRRASYEMAYLLYKLAMRVFAIGYA
ncbi:cardiolipin synthase ClsB [Massilia horti]|uniref:Cardiolipin synthase B n=1 Tax=Massilia horti TaxID=2562153 RepID=A0A4Y9SVI6_9BURK|nr:cardiolipin synthase ClsB [Massilia horti]TFW30802.1 cardiolipin synthase ClsB [Massilia horti]